MTIEANGIDNEDFINLTIGEGEENFLVKKTESHERHKNTGEIKKMEESKKGDYKESSRAEAGANNKGINIGWKRRDEEQAGRW